VTSAAATITAAGDELKAPFWESDMQKVLARSSSRRSPPAGSTWR
jgi:hypothetical protein